ncbi:hypothetical protein [Nostoc edaphicum]|uniref:hypothetical protein n=1 Tax=Nostoc edaphicum TaxID=264686 RepID=UPI001D147DDD|nr:hypothetical protein [Nostoc edaphicum]
MSRKQAEEQLSEVEQKYRTLVEKIPGDLQSNHSVYRIASTEWNCIRSQPNSTRLCWN